MKNKTDYLMDFHRQKEKTVKGDSLIKDDELINKVIDLIKKEGLTYEEAYASLQYTKNLINFQKRFL